MTEKIISKQHFKITIATAVVVILFIVGLAMQLATWKADMCAQHKEFDDRITHIGEKVVDMRAEITTLNDRANGRDVEVATITTKLTNIETLLIELKIDLKELSNER